MHLRLYCSLKSLPAKFQVSHGLGLLFCSAALLLLDLSRLAFATDLIPYRAGGIKRIKSARQEESTSVFTTAPPVELRCILRPHFPSYLLALSPRTYIQDKTGYIRSSQAEGRVPSLPSVPADPQYEASGPGIASHHSIPSSSSPHHLTNSRHGHGLPSPRHTFDSTRLEYHAPFSPSDNPHDRHDT